MIRNMKKNLFYFVLGFGILLLSSYRTEETTAPKNKTISLKKGEVFDILLLSQNSNTSEDLKLYFRDAAPVARRMSYQPLPSFKIKGHTQGNHRPENLILAKWSNLEQREAFLTEIIKEVPDFHERRRKIWSYFGLCYFEMQEDVSFTIDTERYYVATAYWMKTKEESDVFFQKWTKQLKKMKGEVAIQLQNGKSPFGYQYRPDHFVISVWENEAAFQAFQKKTQKLKTDNIKHVNEFIM